MDHDHDRKTKARSAGVDAKSVQDSQKTDPEVIETLSRNQKDQLQDTFAVDLVWPDKLQTATRRMIDVVWPQVMNPRGYLGVVPKERCIALPEEVGVAVCCSEKHPDGAARYQSLIQREMRESLIRTIRHALATAPTDTLVACANLLRNPSYTNNATEPK